MADLRETVAEVQANGRQRSTRCPAHDDRRASLSVGVGDSEQVLVHCHAGCTTNAVLDAAGLAMSDLFPVSSPTTRRIVAEYCYSDERAKSLYDVVRFAPKGFSVRRADGKWTMRGVRRVLYRLPELQQQAMSFIVEGEKDVDRLWGLGLPATTGMGGAGKWCNDYAQQLVAAKVKSVVVLPDNDDPGRAHAGQVARSCYDAGLDVKVVTLADLPSKGDVSDWLASGHTRQELEALVTAAPPYLPVSAPAAKSRGRQVHLTKASSIKVRPVRWLWHERVALGALTLVGGREGVGKSITVYTLAAEITRGRLTGIYHGTPRAVMVAATEDSWEHTIVPRLMAAEADLDLIYRIEVATPGINETALSLPHDLAGLEQNISEVGAALVILDPLLSRLDASLDSHKDADVRQALEPLVALGDRTGASILGLIHVNKSASGDPLTMLMASRAFAAVARSVLFVMTNPEDEGSRMLGVVKSNLGRLDVPTLLFTVLTTMVATTDEGEVRTGKLVWTGESRRSIKDALEATTVTKSTQMSAIAAAGDWLLDYLESKGGSADSADVKEAGRNAGHNEATLQRAREKRRVVATSIVGSFPRRTEWALPGEGKQSSQPGESEMTATTATTAIHGEESSQSLQSWQSPQPPIYDMTGIAASGAEDEGDAYF